MIKLLAALFFGLAVRIPSAGVLAQAPISKIRVYPGDMFLIEFKYNFTTTCPAGALCNALVVKGEPNFVKNLLSVALTAKTTGVAVYGWADATTPAVVINSNTYWVLQDLGIQ